MVESIKYKIDNYLANSSKRSNIILKNIVGSFIIKGGSTFIGLLLIPMTIDYINPVQYGIWLTISSIITWMNFFDVGLANGLRNNLTASVAKNNYKLAKIYVSTTYALLAIISIILFAIITIIVPIIDWAEFFNISNLENNNIKYAVKIVLYSFCILFIVQIINTILISMHNAAKSSLLNLYSQLGVLIIIYFFKNYIPGNLSTLVWVLTFTPIVVYIVASCYYYSSKLNNIAPNLKYIQFKYAKQILNIGSTYFFIQIGALILFQSNNIIITKVLGPLAVTEYNIAYKLFSVIIIVFTTIITPYWPAFADAYVKKDFTWIKYSLFKVRKMWFAMSLIFIPLMCLFSGYIYERWVGDNVNISIALSINMGLYVIGYTGMMLNCYFLNGVGKLRIQLLLYIVVCIINIPISTYFCRLYGVPGIAFASTLIFAFMNFFLWIQSNKIVNEKATGIWNK